MPASTSRASMLNRFRRHPRVRIPTPIACELAWRDEQRWFGKSVHGPGVVYDLSLRGMRVSTEAPIKPGDQVSLLVRSAAANGSCRNRCCHGSLGERPDIRTGFSAVVEYLPWTTSTIHDGVLKGDQISEVGLVEFPCLYKRALLAAAQPAHACFSPISVLLCPGRTEEMDDDQSGRSGRGVRSLSCGCQNVK